MTWQWPDGFEWFTAFVSVLTAGVIITFVFMGGHEAGKRSVCLRLLDRARLTTDSALVHSVCAKEQN